MAGPNILVEPRRTPLSGELAPVVFGNMPRDGGHLIIEAGAHDLVAADPVAAKYIRPFAGSDELVNGRLRWCLWMVDLEPTDLDRSRVLRSRVDSVRTSRLQSKAPSTRSMASTPHLFAQRSGGYSTPYLGIPRVVSENRPYYLAARLGPEVIPSDRLFTAPDPDGLLFGVISSTMFLTWQLLVGNRLESRPSFSNTLVWNNFPLPELSDTSRRAIVDAGKNVLSARRSVGAAMSLAEMYGATLPPLLLDAHRSLDHAVDLAFNLRTWKPLEDPERQDLLLRGYAAMAR